MSEPASNVAAVVVSYNVRELLLACLATLTAAQAAGELAEIVVVDHASTDGSPAAVRACFPNVRLLEAPNRGYGAGINRGLAATASRYVLALNPDTRVPPGAIRTLATYLDAHPTVAVAGPRLRYPNGALQSTRRRFPARLTPLFESTILQEWWPRNRWARAYYREDLPDDAPQPVDWLVGACLLVRRVAVARVGGFDERFRMYSEEVEWCWRFQRHGWQVAYVPSAEITHVEGASTRQDLPTRQLDFDTSRVELAQRLYGARWARVTRYGLRANYALHLSREAAKWLLGHRRPLRRQRIAFYTQALRAPLRRAEHEAA